MPSPPVVPRHLGLYEKIHFLHRCYRYRLRTERQQLAKMLSYPLAGRTVFDVGGNHGIYTYWLSRAVGKQGEVHVFEPQPELAEEIKAVARWLSMAPTRVNAVALSNEADRKVLKRDRVGDGSATLHQHIEARSAIEEIHVPALTMDAYCDDHQVTGLAFIKIDVEGHELAVLRGGLKSIEKFKPVIQVELRVHEPTCDGVIALLEGLGYQGRMLCDGKEVPSKQYKQVPSAKFGFKGHRDFIFDIH